MSDVNRIPILSPAMPGIEKVTFRAILSARGQEYSGMMVIKQMSGNEYRVAFFSEVGMSYLEGSLKGEDYPWALTCNSVSPLLSSTTVLKNLETSLNLLLVPGNQNSIKTEPGYVYGEEDYPSKIFYYSGKKTVFLTLEKI